MAGFTLKTKRDAGSVKESTGSSFIGSSGVYPAKIDFVSLEETDKGAVRFNINLEVNGNKQTIYGNTVQNKDGSENTIGTNLLNKLLVIAGMAEGQEPDVETETHKVGKDGTATEFLVITDLSGMEIQIQVKEVFTKYEGNIQRALEPYNFFRVDGATAAEIVASETDKTVKFGDQLAKILAKEATTKPLYKENRGTNEAAPTEDEVKAYITAKAKGGAAAPKSTVTTPKKAFFGKK